MNTHPTNILSICKISPSSLISKIIPILSKTSLKGDNGCVATIGGSLEYTGAPYYSGITSLKSGSDLSHIFCHKEAAIPIKCYSPELIVHPGFESFENKTLLTSTQRWFKSMNSIAIGPGLGRLSDIQDIFIQFSNHIFDLQNIPVVYDADAIYFMSHCFDKLKIHNKLIITPNNSEFNKLIKKLIDPNSNLDKDEQMINIDKLLKENNIDEKSEIICINNVENSVEIKKLFENEFKLCEKIKNNILVKKGQYDIILNGKVIYIVKNEGSIKRTGGIGDILTGMINCYCGMMSKSLQNKKNSECELIECAVLGCFMCREASRIAYEKNKLSLTAPDIINEIKTVTLKYNI